MGLGRELAREYLRHRLYGNRYRRYGYSPMIGGRPYGIFGAPRHRGVRVSSCGCCLPIPLGMVAGAGLGMRLLVRSRP